MISFVIKRIWSLLFVLALVMAPCLLSADPLPGTPREELITRYGEPKSSVILGEREILSYEAGKVVLRDGKVVECDFSARGNSSGGSDSDMASAPKKTVSAAPTPSSGWLTDFDQAKIEAKASRRRLLVLFTGSTWCPACIRFERDLAHDPHFLEGARSKYVLVKLDFLRGQWSSGSRAAAVAQSYEVGGYPTLIMMNAAGKEATRVDLMTALNQPENKAEALLAMIGAQKTSGKAKAQVIALGFAALVFVVWWLKRN